MIQNRISRDLERTQVHTPRRYVEAVGVRSTWRQKSMTDGFELRDESPHSPLASLTLEAVQVLTVSERFPTAFE